MRVLYYHSVMKHTTFMGSYKTLKGALKAARKSKAYFANSGATWMHVWIGE